MPQTASISQIDGISLLNSIVLRPISSGERSDWDSLMAKHHYLGFLNPVIFKYCDGKRKKIHYPKSVNFDKNGEAPVVCSLVLQYGRNQRPMNFSFVNEN